jgi:hypothetical protein
MLHLILRLTAGIAGKMPCCDSMDISHCDSWRRTPAKNLHIIIDTIPAALGTNDLGQRLSRFGNHAGYTVIAQWIHLKIL